MGHSAHRVKGQPRFFLKYGVTNFLFFDNTDMFAIVACHASYQLGLAKLIPSKLLLDCMLLILKFANWNFQFFFFFFFFFKSASI